MKCYNLVFKQHKMTVKIDAIIPNLFIFKN